MTTITAHIPTQSGSKYLQQLCKHWSHKLEVEQEGEEGTVRFPEAVVKLAADDKQLSVTIDADDAVVDHIKHVVVAHLDRFAFREVPLDYNWS